MIKQLSILQYLVLLLFGSFVGLSAVAQDSTESVPVSVPDGGARDLRDHWDTWRGSHLQEAVYVHTDKDAYVAGEILWFKVYDVDADTHRPLGLSKVAYVEVLDPNNRPVLQGKVGLTKGSGSGSFSIPFTLTSGRYQLRAYTGWMRNYAPDYYFHKLLTFVNTREAYAPPVRKAAAPLVLRFFPEGGNLVSGLTSVVAFKAETADGDPPAFRGWILDDKEDTILALHSGQFGMGRFMLTPQPGRKYEAHVLVDSVGALEQVFGLPAAYPEGYVMAVSPGVGGAAGSAFQVFVSSSGSESGSTAAARVYLLAQTRGSLRLVQGADLAGGQHTFVVPRKVLGEGISHFTLFDANRHPLCERLVFVYPRHPEYFHVGVDAELYPSRSPVDIDLSAGDSSIAAGSDFSVSVYRLDSVQGADPSDIRAYLWLSSDLKGFIPSPGWFLENQDTERVEALDNLLLTQGWRRFRWEDVLSGAPPSFTYPLEFDGHIIAGRVVDTRTGKPVGSIQAYLSVPGARAQFSTASSDTANGRVYFNMKDMYGSSSIVVQTNTLLDSAYRVEISDPFSESYANMPIPAWTLPTDRPWTFREHNLSMQVQRAYAGYRLQQFKLPPIDTVPFFGKPDLTYNLDDYVRFTTVEEVLREYVQLVNVGRKGSHFHIWNFDDPHFTPFDDNPLVLVDGVPIFDMDRLFTYDPLKLKRIDVVTRRYFIGNDYFEGIDNWVSYKGDMSDFELDPHATLIDYEGLQDIREFYSPVYETAAQKGSRSADFRNVLYWNPTVKLSSSGQRVLRFYTSDLPGKYLIVAEGLTPGGEPLHGTAEIEVE